MLNLIKKDYLIAEKMWIIVLILFWVVPLFLNFMAEEKVMSAGLVITVVSVLLGTMLLSSVFEEEEKYPRASALITTLGYKRSTQVLNRYLVAMVIYFYSVVVYFIETFFLKSMSVISLFDLGVSFFVFAFVIGIYLSLSYKYGVRAGRYVMFSIIMLISLGPTLVVKLGFKPDVSFLIRFGTDVLSLIFILSALAIYSLSFVLAKKFYRLKEL